VFEVSGQPSTTQDVRTDLWELRPGYWLSWHGLLGILSVGIRRPVVWLQHTAFRRGILFPASESSRIV
jgi:hypothetical protein